MHRVSLRGVALLALQHLWELGFHYSFLSASFDLRFFLLNIFCFQHEKFFV